MEEINKINEKVENSEISEEKPEAAENCSAVCEECFAAQEEINRLTAEVTELRAELEGMKKLPKFSVKGSGDKSSGDEIRSIFRRR